MELGASVKLVCDSQEAFFPDRIKWYRLKRNDNGEFYEDLIEQNEQYVYDEDGNLIFLKIIFGDDSKFEGYNSPYYCKYKSTFKQTFNGSQIFVHVNISNIWLRPLIPLHISHNNG